jgi:NitT/TauT family transport system ATP-binding protein
MRVDDEVLVKVEHLDKSFTGAAGDTLLVLDDIGLDLHAGGSRRCCAASPA